MRTFVFSDLIFNKQFKDSRHVAYCYMGDRRGSIAIMDKDQDIKVVSQNGYVYSGLESIVQNDTSNFELWAFIHDMTDDEDVDTRQEAVNVFFDVYNNLYFFMEVFREYQFITE